MAIAIATRGSKCIQRGNHILSGIASSERPQWAESRHCLAHAANLLSVTLPMPGCLTSHPENRALFQWVSLVGCLPSLGKTLLNH
jgi:hypothetical protein